MAILFIWRQIQLQKADQLILINGITMGVVEYNIKFIDAGETSHSQSIDSILTAFNNSLSTYLSTSEISIFNEEDSIQFSSPFLLPVLEISKDIYLKSEGSFDPSIGPLVDAWGFGKDKGARIDSAKVDSLKALVGFDQVIFNKTGAYKPHGMTLDFSASAKGYAIDLVAEYLDSQQIDNYMVEIGGEVICKGRNQEGKVWKIGIEKPALSQSRGALFATTFVHNRALATSGNYRNYYEENGKMIAHTLDPVTGFPSQHNLLSATIYANTCAEADGFATACMVMGLERSKKLVEDYKDLEGFFIYSDELGILQWHASAGIANQIEVLD